MNNNKKIYKISAMAKVLRVSKSGFYDWVAACEVREKREAKELRLIKKIEEIHQGSGRAYGSPRVFKVLEGLGLANSEDKIARIMKKNNIRSKIKRKFKATTNSNHKLPISPNHLMQDFRAYEPNQIWASDITYIWTAEGWLYLAAILDLFSRRIVGWGMSDRLTKELALSALKMAYQRRKPEAGLVHHADQGSQYASKDYQNQLKAYGMISSMSRRANCWDNSVIESFFHSLKTEMVFFETYRTRDDARRSIFRWIEWVYNRNRIHSSIDYLTPEKFEELNDVKKHALL